MKALASAAPLTGLQHVKRIRKPQGASAAATKLQILLCPVPAPASALPAAIPTCAPGLASRAIPSSGAERPAQPGSGSGGASDNATARETAECSAEGSAEDLTKGSAEGSAGFVSHDPAGALPAEVHRIVSEYGLQPICVQV